MAEDIEKKSKGKRVRSYQNTDDDNSDIKLVLDHWIKGNQVLSKSYNQFNGRTLSECIDDWEKRWNGFIPAMNPLLDQTQSQIFLNFTRNVVIDYLVKIALSMPKPKIVSLNKKLGVSNKRFAELLKDLNIASLNAENGDARFFESAFEAAVKGTVIKYEGYSRTTSTKEVPIRFDAETGKMETKEQEVVEFDDCYQELVPLEDFLFPNAYQPDVQKQPWVIWQKITTRDEAAREYGHYKNFKYVKGGQYTLPQTDTTFYRNSIAVELGKDQTHILRYYNKAKRKHIVLINGVPIYRGVIPYLNNKYPFAKGIFEPFQTLFFWGSSFPQKIMGDQDTKNTLWNMMIDKTYGSLLPFGLTSDADDIIEDDVLEVNKIRQVGDINKWKFDTLPGVNAGETSMLEFANRFGQEHAGSSAVGGSSSPKGGKLSKTQLLLKQQENMQKLGFSGNFLEDFERDRTQLRIDHILQFYSIPRIEKTTGTRGKEVEKLIYREVKVPGIKLQDGRMGDRHIKLVGELNDEEKTVLGDELSVTEEIGEKMGTPTEAVAMQVQSFDDYNHQVQIVKNSSYEKNQILDQTARIDFANWRLALAQLAPCDATEIVKWVEESFDIDTERFAPKQGGGAEMAALMAGGPGGGEGGSGKNGSGVDFAKLGSFGE